MSPHVEPQPCQQQLLGQPYTLHGQLFQQHPELSSLNDHAPTWKLLPRPALTNWRHDHVRQQHVRLYGLRLWAPLMHRDELRLE
jgi:hypothetical protein